MSNISEAQEGLRLHDDFEPLSYIEARVELVPSLPLLHNLAMQSGILVVPVKGGFVEIWTHRDEELRGVFIIFSKLA